MTTYPGRIIDDLMIQAFRKFEAVATDNNLNILSYSLKS
ncbi:hypothetical protein DSUL_20522 [Desulfovibrionales bacterium]